MIGLKKKNYYHEYYKDKLFNYTYFELHYKMYSQVKC